MFVIIKEIEVMKPDIIVIIIHKQMREDYHQHFVLLRHIVASHFLNIKKLAIAVEKMLYLLNSCFISQFIITP